MFFSQKARGGQRPMKDFHPGFLTGRALFVRLVHILLLGLSCCSLFVGVIDLTPGQLPDRPF